MHACSLSLHQIHSELTNWWNNISLRWGFSSMRSSTPSRNNCGLGVRDQSDMIPHFPEQKNIAPTMTARDTRPSTLGPLKVSGRAHPLRSHKKSTPSLPKQPPDLNSLTLHRLSNSHNTWSLNPKQLSDFMFPRDRAVLLSLIFLVFQFHVFHSNIE